MWFGYYHHLNFVILWMFCVRNSSYSFIFRAAFEPVQVLSSWYEDVHVVWALSLHYFLFFQLVSFFMFSESQVPIYTHSGHLSSCSFILTRCHCVFFTFLFFLNSFIFFYLILCMYLLIGAFPDRVKSMSSFLMRSFLIGFNLGFHCKNVILHFILIPQSPTTHTKTKVAVQKKRERGFHSNKKHSVSALITGTDKTQTTPYLVYFSA